MTSLPPVHSLPINTLCAPVETTARALSASARRTLLDTRHGMMFSWTDEAFRELFMHGLCDRVAVTDRGLAVRLHLIAGDDAGWALASWVLGIGHLDSVDDELAGEARTLARICAGEDVPWAADDIFSLIDAGLIEPLAEVETRLALTSLGRERLAALTPADLAGEAVLRAVNLTGEGR